MTATTTDRRLKLVMWAVGPEDGEPWYAIRAKTERGAVSTYLAEHGGNRRSMTAMRMPQWDTLERVTKIDWFTAGAGLMAMCDLCEAMTCPEEGGAVIRGEIWCEDCQRTYRSC